MASRETFHVEGARSPHWVPNQAANRSALDLVRRGVAAELGDDPAQDAAVRAAGAGLLGPAQGGQVGVDGPAECDVTGGRAGGGGLFPRPEAIRGNGPLYLITCSLSGVRLCLDRERHPWLGCP